MSILSLASLGWSGAKVELINWSLPWEMCGSPLEIPESGLSRRPSGGIGARIVMSLDIPDDIIASLGDMSDSLPTGDIIILSWAGVGMPWVVSVT
jgi:hypothetical protein